MTFCNHFINRTEVGYVKNKPQVGCYDEVWSLATNSLTVVSARCAGALYRSNLSWFSAFYVTKKMKYAYDRKFPEI